MTHTWIMEPQTKVSENMSAKRNSLLMTLYNTTLTTYIFPPDLKNEPNFLAIIIEFDNIVVLLLCVW